MMLSDAGERFASSQRALPSIPQLRVGAGVCAERPHCRSERGVSRSVIYSSDSLAAVFGK